MFQHCSYQLTIRPASPLLVAANATLNGPVADPNTGALIWIVQTESRTMGTYSAQAFGSINGTSFYSLGDTMKLTAIGANGFRYIQLSGALPPFLRLELTPAGGFDGDIEAVLRSASFVGIDEYANS